MQAYRDILSRRDIAAVAAFVEQELVGRKRDDMRYHSRGNGWPDHDERYGAAYPFVLGRIPVDVPVRELSAEHRIGRRIFRESCSICHEPALKPETRQADSDVHGILAAGEQGTPGRDHYGSEGDGRDHTTPPRLADPSPVVIEGMRLYQRNCAECHAADGSGKNWIGRFLEPHPPDLTSADYGARFAAGTVRRVVNRGLAGTSMPGFGAVFTKKEIDAIIAYMARAFVRR